MKSLAKSIFGNAQVYVRSSDALLNASQTDVALSLPSNVLASLSLELYFKSLNILEHGVEFKVNNKHSHHFAQIFGELKDETKKDLCERFDVAKSRMDPNRVPYLESLMGVIPKDLKSNLVQWQTIFVDLRYVHSFIEKHKNKRVVMEFYPQIVESVHNAILAREPDWANTATPFNPAQA
jgi:hypothetical protein